MVRFVCIFDRRTLTMLTVQQRQNRWQCLRNQGIDPPPLKRLHQFKKKNAKVYKRRYKNFPTHLFQIDVCLFICDWIAFNFQFDGRIGESNRRLLSKHEKTEKRQKKKKTFISCLSISKPTSIAGESIWVHMSPYECQFDNRLAEISILSSNWIY